MFATSAEIHAVIVATHYSVVQIVVVRALKKSLALVESMVQSVLGEEHMLR